MKKIITIPLMLLAGVILLAGCTKRHYYDDNNDIETGRVEYAPDNYAWYSVVDLGDTYAFIETLSNKDEDFPYEGERLTGTFYNDGKSNRVYNENGKFYTYILVHGFYNYKSDAMNAVDDYHYRYDNIAGKATMSRASKTRPVEVVK